MNDLTLCIIDTVDIDRAVFAMDKSFEQMNFLCGIIITNKQTKKYPRYFTEINSIEAYSRFVVNELHKYIKTEFVLLIQWDGFILNAAAWNPVWMDYDYIGAPITGHWDWGKNGRTVGNGGFSLRSQKYLRESAALKLKDCHPEDNQLCVLNAERLEAQGVRFAPVEEARKFSIEGGVWDGQFGFHDHQLTDISKSGIKLPEKKR